MAPGLMNPFIKFPSGVDAVGGWVELARTTLGSAGDTITVSSLADKRYYMVLGHHLPSGNFRTTYSINNDSGSNYALRKSEDGGAENVTVNQTVMKVGNKDEATDYFDVSYIANLSSLEKLLINHNMRNNGTGAGNAPSRVEAYPKWVNTSSVLNRIDALNDQGGDYATGSQVVVLGWDPADTHTTNFWEELDTDTGSSIDLSFTGKKYMWLQFYLKATGGTLNPRMRVGNTTVDTGSTIAQRASSNGATDATSVNQTFLDILGITLQSGESHFGNYFIVNNASNEKLFIGHTVSNNGSGQAIAPDRFQYVGKWANAVDLMDVLQITKSSGTGTQDTTSFAKIWGSN